MSKSPVQVASGMMNAIIPNRKLLLFLDGMSITEFRPAPKGTGLKSAIVARDCGLVEWSGAGPRWTFRLTPKGAGVLAPLREHVARLRSRKRNRSAKTVHSKKAEPPPA